MSKQKRSLGNVFLTSLACACLVFVAGVLLVGLPLAVLAAAGCFGLLVIAALAQA